MRHQELLRLDERTWIEASVAADGAYRLALCRDGAPLLEFQSANGRHWKRSGERTMAYEFRSIEQLRYDFEREIQGLVDRH